MADTKTIYHGALRDLGPVTVTVLSEPKASTKQKGKFYVELQLEGKTRYYNPENQQCQDFFKGRKGQTIAIVAEGTREEATISAVGQPASTLPPKQPAPPPQPPSRPRATRPAVGSPEEQFPEQHQPPPSTELRTQRTPEQQAAEEQKDLKQAKRFLAKNATLARLALKKLLDLKREYEQATKELMPDAVAASVYGTLLHGAAKQEIPGPNMPLDLHIPLVGGTPQ
jgi:hypothetical protein